MATSALVHNFILPINHSIFNTEINRICVSSFATSNGRQREFREAEVGMPLIR